MFLVLFELNPNLIPLKWELFLNRSENGQKLPFYCFSLLWDYEDVSKQHLIPKGKKKDVSNYKGYKTFDRLCKSMNEVLNETLCEHVYEEAMFYNYFLRPATVRKNNRSFKKDCTQLDRDVAGSALCGIIDLDRPDVVIFVSKYAHSEFRKYLESNKLSYAIPIDFVNHPAHPASWHHRNGNGKQKFERLLREYWIAK